MVDLTKIFVQKEIKRLFFFIFMNRIYWFTTNLYLIVISFLLFFAGMCYWNNSVNLTLLWYWGKLVDQESESIFTKKLKHKFKKMSKNLDLFLLFFNNSSNF